MFVFSWHLLQNGRKYWLNALADGWLLIFEKKQRTMLTKIGKLSYFMHK